MISLLPYQVPHAVVIETALRKHRVSIDVSQTGTGKTYVAAHIAANLGQPVVVICPKAVIPVWKRVLAAAGVTPLAVLNYELLVRGSSPVCEKKTKAKFVWKIPEDTLIIWDEAHRCQGNNSLSAKAMRDAKMFNNLLLSATLAESPIQMRAMGYLTGLHNWDGWWWWARKTGCSKNPWGGLVFKKTTALEQMHKLHERLFPEYGGGIRIADLGDAFPETQITAEAYDLGSAKEMQEIYEEMQTKVSELLTSGNVNSANILVEQLRARQAVELLKVAGISKMAEDLVAEGHSVVIFTNFVESLRGLQRALQTDCAVCGGQKDEDRQKNIEDFQADRQRIIIVNIQAGGVALSLHDENGNFPRVALVCPTFNAKDLRQALGRVHRAGGKTKSLQRIIFAEGTIETVACSAVQRKLDSLDALNDGDLSFEKRLNETQTAVSETPRMTSIQEAPATREHAKHSPSSLLYKAKCPGFRGDSGTNIWADRGNLGHEAVEKLNPSLCDHDPVLKASVERCIAYIRKLEGTAHPEIKLQVLDQYGYLDLLILKGSHAHIVDYKFTRNKYDANSPQFWAYCIGVWDAHPEVESIEVHVLMPDLGIIEIETFNRKEDYNKLVGWVRSIIVAAEKADPATFNIGKQCSYCSLASSCGKITETAANIAKNYSGDIIPVPQGAAHGSQITDVDYLSSLLRLAPILEKAVEGWKKRALELRMSGENIPGYELVERAGTRKITDSTAAYSLFVEKGGTPEDFAKAADVKLTIFEDLFTSLAPKGEKGKWKEQLTELLAARSAISSGAPSRYLQQVKHNN